jgi:hypothetical protein
MQGLSARVSGPDAQAGAALNVITSFAKLNDGRAGPEMLIRGIAILVRFSWLGRANQPKNVDPY